MFIIMIGKTKGFEAESSYLTFCDPCFQNTYVLLYINIYKIILC